MFSISIPVTFEWKPFWTHTLLHLQAGSPVLLTPASALALLWMVKNCASGTVVRTVFITSLLSQLKERGPLYFLPVSGA